MKSENCINVEQFERGHDEVTRWNTGKDINKMEKIKKKLEF